MNNIVDNEDKNILDMFGKLQYKDACLKYGKDLTDKLYFKFNLTVDELINTIKNNS